MNLYEHTIITRPDVSPAQIKQLQDKYIKLVEKFEGNIEKVENWGLLNLSYIIKKNKKGNYIHFKIKGNGKTISELEKNEKLDKSLLRYLNVKVKKFDLNTNYFEKKSDEIKDKSN
jgi:small subunit ribosomal protein S6